MERTLALAAGAVIGALIVGGVVIALDGLVDDTDTAADAGPVLTTAAPTTPTDDGDGEGIGSDADRSGADVDDGGSDDAQVGAEAGRGGADGVGAGEAPDGSGDPSGSGDGRSGVASGDVVGAPGTSVEDLAAEVTSREPPEPEPAGEVSDDHIFFETLITGVGYGVQVGDVVAFHYVGVLADGTVFDESWSHGAPIEAPVGEGMLVEGLEGSLVGALSGERRRIVLGPDAAYGDEGNGNIPPGAEVAYEVDIVSITPGPGHS